MQELTGGSIGSELNARWDFQLEFSIIQVLQEQKI